MPPRTRTRATKVLKENIDVVKKIKQKPDGKASKPSRKALADKTNSLSDDNASIDVPIKTSKKAVKSNAPQKNAQDTARPRRERRLPPRYIENQVLKNLSNSKDSPVKQSSVTSENTPAKKIEKTLPNENEIKAKKTIPTPIKSSIIITNNSISHVKSHKQAVESDKPQKPETKEKSSKNGVTDAIRPKRKCRLQSAVEKPPSKDSSLNVSSPFKTPPKNLDSSLIGNRPRRICRLPSKFEDHSISPNKFVPVQPCHASTPILQKNRTTTTTNTQKNLLEENIQTNTKDRNGGKNKSANKPILRYVQKSRCIKTNAKASTSSSSIDKSSPDTNNNGKNKKIKAATKPLKTGTQTSDQDGGIAPFRKRLLENSFSFKILDDKKQTNKNDKNLDVYEFTFDPNEEPVPQKKKRKKTVRKKQAQPKKVLLKSNYDSNVSKALENLKRKIKPSQTETVQSDTNLKEKNIQSALSTVENVHSNAVISKPDTNESIPQSNNYSANIAPEIPINKSAAGSIHASNYASIRVEDIAADFELSDHNDINYSPVTTPNRPQTPKVPEIIVTHVDPVNKDPLNLQEDLSFFDEQPVASSSMNVSVRHPLASPWRTEFGSLPLKWHSNTYVKPNMTPAVESSFINSEGTTKKKHVYTNIVPEEPLPEIENTTPNLIQTSIISFIKEVVEKNANKKKRKISPSPVKANSIFDDITSTSVEFGYKTPKKAKKTIEKTAPNFTKNNRSNETENSNQSNKSVSLENGQTKDKDCTYFGFDDSEHIDQENISPVKVNTKTRSLRPRPVLQQLNALTGPTRTAMPGVAKPKLASSEVVEQLYDQLKSAEVAPQFPENDICEAPTDNATTNVDNPLLNENDDSQSVHLFEDIEIVHHLKPHRKSYGKAKKVTFPQSADSDSDSQPPMVAESEESDNDDLADLTFHMPDIKPKRTMKKKKPKKQLTKKEEKEVEEWAAGFNSMCEDVEEFPLVVE